MTASQDDTHAPLDKESAASGPNLSENKASTVSPGEILREARLAHDYSVEDLCAQTKLGAKTVRALEDNDFEALSQPVFARGYYRQCAKVLDVDVERINRAYSAWAGEPEKTAPSSVSNVNLIAQDVTPGGSRFGWLWLVLVIAAAAIAILLLMSPGSDDGGDEDEPVTTASTATPNGSTGISDRATASSDGQVTTNADGAAAAGQGSNVTPGSGNDSAPVARTGETASGRNVNQSLGITPPDEAGDNARASDDNATPDVPANRLELTFEKRSWVRVTDADGNRLASGIFEAGQTETYDAPAPYQLRLGFAPGVKVSIGGTAVDVAAQTNGSSVANISVAARDDTSDGDEQ